MRNIRSDVENDGLKAYFDQIKRADLLSFEEELELSKRIQKGEEAAKQKLIEANLRLVVRIAKSFKTPDVSLLDLIQEGNLGLMKAAAKYDHRKQVRFSTYASWWIKQSIVRSLSNKRRAIRLPHRKEEKLRKINKAYNALSQQLQRAPKMSEIAHEIGMKEKDIENILSLSTNVVSLSCSPGADNGTLQELIEDTTYEPGRELIENSLREETRRFLETLLEKEKQILMYRFAFYGGKKYTLKSIGDELGISPETVRQIEIRALKKLRKTADSLKEYVYSR
jgi:RNA polymerase primary sigma factor